MLSVVIERLKLSACSFFLFVLKQKEKTNQKRKTRLLQYRLWRYKTANAVICVFAYRQKSLSAPKDNGARFQDVRPLRSEQSLFATRQQGGIWEQVQMISERSSGRGVSLRPVSLRSKKWGKVVLMKQKLPITYIMLFITLFYKKAQ